MARKNAAAVTLGRRGGLKGGPARAAAMTPEERSASARKAVLSRWGKTPNEAVRRTAQVPVDTSDKALVGLLKRLKATVDPKEIRQISDQIERVIFHKQFKNA